MDDLNSRPVDRGPSTDTGDGPQTPRGMWRLLAIPDVDHVRAMAIARHHYSWATLERAVPDRLTKLVGRKVAEWIAAHGIPDVDLPVPVDGTVMTPWSPEFPLQLRDIPGCPPILWVRGQLPDQTAVTLVGEPGWVVSDAVLRRAATGCVARQVTAVAVDVPTGRTALQAGCRTVLVTDGQATADDPTLAEGAIGASYWTSGIDPEAEARFEERWGSPATVHRMMAYYGVHLVLADAIERSIEATGDVSRAAIRDALEEVDLTGTPLGDISFDDHNQAYPFLTIDTITDGQIELIDTIPGTPRS